MKNKGKNSPISQSPPKMSGQNFSGHLYLILSLLGALIIAAGLALLSQPGPVSANTSYDVSLARAAYPHLAGTDFECTLCHTRYGSRTLNAYGSAYRSNGRNAAALAALENVDTDGDGYLNIDEITALTSPADAADHPHDDLLARQKYPAISGTRLDDCVLCHSSGSSLNPYGQAYRDNGRNLAAFGLIEAVDSDGDGYPNLDEITALTFPGDAGDNPVQENEDLALARQKYPAIAATRLDSCSLCHSSGGADLNGYGLAYQQNGRDLTAFDLIQAQDADGDEFTNLEEIAELTFPGDAADRPHDDRLVLKKYPHLAGTRLESCNLCHCSCGELLDYGRDYLAHGRNLAAFAAIEGLDSDGDGYTNLAEIEALTFPSNASDTPLNQHNHQLLVLEQYPHIAGTRLEECNFCHASEFSRNAYGAAYAGSGYDFAAIERLDSDGDGFVNIDEINLLTFPGHADDHPDDLALVTTVYPQLSYTDLASCDLCHLGNPYVDPALNPYGQAYRANGRNPAALVAIEDFDSDGDDYANLLELTLLTFPGDPDDYPDEMSILLFKYPSLEGTPLHTCTICHTGDWGLNPYGADYLAYGDNWQALGLIEALDSDQDDYPNLAEINALTFPGDAASNPAAITDNWQLFLPLLLK